MKGFVRRRVAGVSGGDAVASEALLWSSQDRDDMSRTVVDPQGYGQGTYHS